MGRRTRKYNGSTAEALDHYFGNNAGICKTWLSDGYDGNFESRKMGFIRGLENTIKKDLPVYEGVTNERLREIAKLAGKLDFSKPSDLLQLYRACYRIRRKKLDEDKLFGKLIYASEKS